MAAQASVRRPGPAHSGRLPAPVDRLSPPVVAGGVVALFIGVTAWWLSQDSHVADYDSGVHLTNAFGYYNAIAAGRVFEPLTAYTGYAPFAELVGSVGRWVGGPHVASAVLAQNVVFVSLLALGCYQTGRLLRGSAAGLLAVVFALGAPMIVGEFHEFFLDPPEAAMVAVTVGLLLASNRFEDNRYSALAGLTAGLGMLTKQTFPFFIAGLVAVMLARGGWRQWRGLLIFALVTAAVAGPWYVVHLDQIRASGASVEAVASGGGRNPPRWSGENLSWYAWAVTNHVLLLPLSLAAAGGAAVGAVRYARTRAKDNLVPELLGGLLASWVILTIFIPFKDNRYILPFLVYAAVLGTAWIVTLPRRWRMLAAAAVVAVSAMNFAVVSLGLGGTVAVEVPGISAREPDHRSVALYTSSGWLTSGPERGGDIPGIVDREIENGVRELGFEPGGSVFFNSQGLGALAAMHRVAPTMDPKALGPDGLFVFTRRPVGRFSRPCVRASDGSPVFFARGGQAGPVDGWTLTCPRPP